MTHSSIVASGDTRRRTGSALVVVLWIIGLLSMLVTSLAFDAHIEAKMTSYYRKRMKAEYLARSGLQIATLLMLKRDEAKKSIDGETAETEDRWLKPAKRLAEGGAVHVEEPLGEGVITLDIVPEPARRNVNLLLKEADWEPILEVGDIPEELWPTLIESAIDWIDADERSGTDGAETEDYYSQLEPPYQAKNGPLDTVDELLLVRGFTKEILFGGDLPAAFKGSEPIRVSGMADLLTTYGDGKVNVNAAPTRVLMTLPGVDELVADAIVEYREGWTDSEGKKEERTFLNGDDLVAKIPELPVEIKTYVSTDSGIFRVNSAGTVNGVRKEIWCIAEFSAAGMKILRWREED